MNIKEENLDLHISCPYTGKILWVREIDPRMYPFLLNAGYNWLFEEKKVIEEPIKKIVKK